LKKIGYLGPPGTFSEQALLTLEKKQNEKFTRLPFDSFPALFHELEIGFLDKIIVPLENSTEGPVTQIHDLLYRSKAIFITKELLLPIHLCLLGKDDYKAEEVTDVFSHHQPISQALEHLTQQCPKAKLHLVSSSTWALDNLKRLKKVYVTRGEEWAFIGNKSLVDLYQLHLIQENIEDVPGNITNFGVIQKNFHPIEEGNNKIFIAFSTHKDQPGSLVRILEIFSKDNINLKKIVSRPSKSALGDYIFFLDFDFSGSQADLEKLFTQMQNVCLDLKHLGSVPQGRQDNTPHD